MQIGPSRNVLVPSAWLLCWARMVEYALVQAQNNEISSHQMFGAESATVSLESPQTLWYSKLDGESSLELSGAHNDSPFG